MRILEKVVHRERGVSRPGQGKELSKDVIPRPKKADFRRLPAQYQNSPGDFGLLVWASVLSGFSRETEPVRGVPVYRKRFIIKNWLMQL